jgi:hypothetical protein
MVCKVWNLKVKIEFPKEPLALTMSLVRWDGNRAFFASSAKPKRRASASGNAEWLAPCARALAFDLERIEELYLRVRYS